MTIKSARTTRDFVRIWFYWKIPAILIFFLIVICVCLYVFTATPMYESTAKIMVLPKTTDETVVSPGADSRQFLARPVTDQDIYTEIDLLQSNGVIKSTVGYYMQTDSAQTKSLEESGKFNILGKLNLTDQKLSDFEKKTKALSESLNVEQVYSSKTISVSLESPYQEQVTEVLNTLLDNYLKHRKKNLSRGDTEVFYGEQKNYYGKKLADAKKKLKDFKARWSIVNMESQTSANLELISDFQKQLKALEVQVSENLAKLRMLEDGLKISDGKFTLTKEMRSMPVIVELSKGLVPLLIKRIEIGRTFTKESREYQQINEQVNMLRKEIKDEVMNASRTDTMENETLIIRRDALANKIKSLKEQSRDFQQKKEEFDALNLEVEIARDNFLKYGAKKEDSRLFTKRDENNLSNIVITEAPSTPRRPKSPKKLFALKISILLGLFAAFILPFILETVDQKLKTSDDIEIVFSLPVVCTYNEV